MEFEHVSVLLHECIDNLNIKPDGIYVDGTLGGAGHSGQIVRRLDKGLLVGIDRDPVALKAAGERLAPYENNVKLAHANFCEMADVFGDRHFILIENYNKAQVLRAIIQCLVDHSSREGSVTHHSNGHGIRAAKPIGLGKPDSR